MTVTIQDVCGLDARRFHYRGDCGHVVTNSPGELDGCPAWVHGQPCPGNLERFGPGSRKP